MNAFARAALFGPLFGVGAAVVVAHDGLFDGLFLYASATAVVAACALVPPTLLESWLGTRPSSPRRDALAALGGALVASVSIFLSSLQAQFLDGFARTLWITDGVAEVEALLWDYTHHFERAGLLLAYAFPLAASVFARVRRSSIWGELTSLLASFALVSCPLIFAVETRPDAEILVPILALGILVHVLVARAADRLEAWIVERWEATE